MNLFYSNVKMTRYLKKLKKSNDIATVLGLDIGRVFVGTSISDRFLTKTKPLKTFELQSGHFFKFYPTHQDEFNLNLEFFYGLNKLIKDNKVKGLVIGYPLVNNQPVMLSFLSWFSVDILILLKISSNICVVRRF